MNGVMRGRRSDELTARCIVNTVFCSSVDDETCQTNTDCDKTKGENPTQGDLLALAQLQTVDNKERKNKYCESKSFMLLEGEREIRT
jgi:hypothetical protein